MPSVKKVSFSARVISVLSEHKICVKVNTNDVQKISDIYSNVFKKTSVRDTITLNMRTAVINVSIQWSNLEDLVGLDVDIVASYYPFYFNTKKEIIDEYGDVRSYVYKNTGITFRVRRLQMSKSDDTQ